MTLFLNERNENFDEQLDEAGRNHFRCLHDLRTSLAALTLHGTVSGDRVKFNIPRIDRGAVAWTDHDGSTPQ
ncbi:MAG: hypothetical protein ACYCOX_00370 [Acidobacteriaceae bacterium]